MTEKFLKITLCAVLIQAFLIPVGIAVAKGPPDKVIITGPGLVEPIEITEVGQLQEFSIYDFENINVRVPEPKDPGQGYVIIRYSYDWLVYYPQPVGERGYILYKGLLSPDMSSEFDGYWYRASERGDMAMRRLLSDAGLIWTHPKSHCPVLHSFHPPL